nr:EOG090X09C5 [Cyclestheria hislopi]
MEDYHKRVNSQESIVGWWATGTGVTSHSVLIHEYYSRECNNPVHITVDTTLQDNHMGIKGYVKDTTDMEDYHKRVNSQESIVGWWATGTGVTSHSVLIHEYYSRECNNPVHITVDTTLQDNHMGIKGYVSVPMGITGKTTGCMFAPVPVEITCYEPETVGLNACQKTKTSLKRQAGIASDLTQIVEASQQMESMLDAVLAYVEDVIAGKTLPDNAIGRSLLDMVHSVPKMSPEEFEEMLNSNRKDLLMVLYLSQLTKTQLALNEKLTLLVI